MLGSVVLEASLKSHVVVVEVLEEICDLSCLVSELWYYFLFVWFNFLIHEKQLKKNPKHMLAEISLNDDNVLW